METGSDWGRAVVVDPRRLEEIESHLGRLQRRIFLLKVGGAVLLATTVVGASAVSWQSMRLASATRQLGTHLEQEMEANAARVALARTYAQGLSAGEPIPSFGSKSWARRFTVTRYLPRSPEYGETNDGLTATMKKADPAARIVAVDPKLIPYGARVWIEGLGWFHAEDCGARIKGFRLDVLTATEEEALSFGKQDRFAIVVPPEETAATPAKGRS
jgi:3D (Asp-Asp-Asp) domain-containing protein